MNQFDNLEDDDQVDEYEDHQYDISAEMSDDFITEHIIPLMNEFENGNPSPDYIPGTASVNLFIKMVGTLTKFGYTVEQLNDIVVECELPNEFDILH
jgi:hypothetical protein